MSTKRRGRAPSRFLYLAAAGLTFSLPQLTQAAESPSQAAPADQETVQTVIVTANRRFENLQSVPVAVEAFSEKDVQKLGVVDAQSLALAVPGLTFNRSSAWSEPYLRGVGTNIGQIGNENSISLYVDDVYLPASIAAFGNFNSIDRVEVLKGPQGTLFGRNATGGVVQVFTRDPSDTPSADLSLGYANYDTTSGSLYATTKLAENLSANIALYGSNQNDGWGRNLATGNPSYTGWDYGARAKLQWTPLPGTKVLVTYDQDTTRTEEGDGGAGNAGTKALFGYALPAGAGYYDVDENLDTYTIARQSGLSVKLYQDVGDWAKITSITAYRYTRAKFVYDLDAGPTNFANADTDPVERTWTEELRLQSAITEPYSWITGFYYFDDLAELDPLQINGILQGRNLFGNSYTREGTQSYAGFAQGTVTILPKMHLTGGLRYTDDNRTFQESLDNAHGPLVVTNSPQQKTFSKLTWRATLDYQFTKDLMGYLAYNRGFKSGFFNFNSAIGTGPFTIAPPVKPETLDAYTAGTKTEFFGNKLKMNIEGFYYNYTNIQVQQILEGVSFATNAAAANIKGVDFDLSAVPIHNLTLTAAAEVLDAHYTSFPLGPVSVYEPGGGNCTANTILPRHSACDLIYYGRNAEYPPTNLSGDQMIMAPPFSLTLSVDYRIPSSVGPWDISGVWSHGGDYYADVDNGRGQIDADADKQRVLDLFNATVNWTSDDRRWGVSIWGKNLTGVKYWSLDSETSFATRYSPAPPLTFGITLSAHL